MLGVLRSDCTGRSHARSRIAVYAFPAESAPTNPMHEYARNCMVSAKLSSQFIHLNIGGPQLSAKCPGMSQISSTAFQLKINPNWPPHPPYVDDPLLLPKYISRYQRP